MMNRHPSGDCYCNTTSSPPTHRSIPIPNTLHPLDLTTIPDRPHLHHHRPLRISRSTRCTLNHLRPPRLRALVGILCDYLLRHYLCMLEIWFQVQGQLRAGIHRGKQQLRVGNRGRRCGVWSQQSTGAGEHSRSTDRGTSARDVGVCIAVGKAKSRMGRLNRLPRIRARNLTHQHDDIKTARIKPAQHSPRHYCPRYWNRRLWTRLLRLYVVSVVPSGIGGRGVARFVDTRRGGP